MKKIKEHKDLEIFEAKANNRLAYRKSYYAYFKGLNVFMMK